jgi:hypothetical protein
MSIKNPEELNDAQKDAVQRMAQFLRATSAKPEPILKMLDRLGIRWERRFLDDVPCIVIKELDLEAGDAKHQAQGSVMQRFYGKDMNQSTEQASSEIEAYLKGMRG